MKKINMYSLSEIFPDETELAERIIFDPEYERIVLVDNDLIMERGAYWYRENNRLNRIEHWSSEKRELKRKEIYFTLLHLDFMLNSEDEFLIINE